MDDGGDDQVAGLLMRDVSRAGVELGRARLEGLPARLTVGELLARRVRADVTVYNADPGPVFAGLVQPADAIRHSDGFHLRRPRPLEADVLVAAAQQAVRAGLLRVQAGEAMLDDLDAQLAADEHDEVVAVLARPVVADDA